jgi:hypothetical protein
MEQGLVGVVLTVCLTPLSVPQNIGRMGNEMEGLWKEELGSYFDVLHYR